MLKAWAVSNFFAVSFRASRSSAKRNDADERNPEDIYPKMPMQGIFSMLSRLDFLATSNEDQHAHSRENALNPHATLFASSGSLSPAHRKAARAHTG